MDLPRVFLSSTSDLVEQREGVRKALELDRLFQPYLYEHDAAGRDAPAVRLRRIIARADVFVALLGARYGSLVPGDPEERSISRWELDLARARQGLPIRAFLLAFPPEQIEERQRRFRDEVTDFETGMWVRPVRSVADLATTVVQELHAWLGEYVHRLRAVRPWVVRWLDRRLFIVAAVAAILGAGLPLVNDVRPFMTALAAFGMGIACGVVIVACMILRNQETGGSDDGISS